MLGVRDLARQIGRDPGTVSRWARRVDWEFGTGPWRAGQVPAIVEWAGRLQEDRKVEAEGTGGGDLGRATSIAKLKLLIEREANLKVIRLIKQQEFVKREEGEAVRARCHETIKRALMQVPRALRQILADTAQPAQVEEILTSALRVVCNEGFDGGGATPA